MRVQTTNVPTGGVSDLESVPKRRWAPARTKVLRQVRRDSVLLVACFLVGVTTGVLMTLTSPKVYAATARVFVATPVATGSQLQQGDVFTAARVQSYAAVVNSPAVTESVIRALRLSVTADQLSAEISATAPLGETLLNVLVVNQDPALAARIANAVAAELPSAIDRIETTRSGGAPAVKLTVIHPADNPTIPIAPRWKKNVAIGMIVGLLVGGGVVSLRVMLDEAVRTSADLRSSGLPVLGTIARARNRPVRPIVLWSHSDSDQAESYRQLRTSIRFIDVDNQPRSFAVASALPGVGASSVALNLAAGLADAGSSVCLVETDLRHPRLAKALGLNVELGLTDVLTGRADLRQATASVGDRFFVLCGGEMPPASIDLFSSARMKHAVAEIAALVDYTVFDTSPLLSVGDGPTIVSLADATLLVVGSGRTTRNDLGQAQEAVARVGSKTAGVVLNMCGD